MKNTPLKTAVALIQKIKREIEESQPSIHTMIEEVKMMQFIIKPIHGDLSSLIKKDHTFVTALWKLGKIDHIIHTEAEQLDSKEKKLFFNYIEHQRLSLPQTGSRLPRMRGFATISHQTSSHHPADFEIEIIKNKATSRTMLN